MRSPVRLTTLLGVIAAVMLCCTSASADESKIATAGAHHHHPEHQRHLEAASTTVDDFETTLHMQQTRSRQRVALGPKRKSVFSRAQAVAQSESVVAAHNRKQREGQSTYTMALNELSDLSDEEYQSFLKSRPEAVAHGKHGHRHHHGTPHLKDTTGSTDSLVAATTVASSSVKTVIPTEVDWLTIENGKYVTPIKNQGTCGSCWAFSGTLAYQLAFDSLTPRKLI